jgi:hypothetical protein
MTDRALLQQALEALELLARYENPETRIQVRKPKDGGPIVTMYPHKVATDAATVLRTAIEQAEKQEPVWDASAPIVMTPHPAFAKRQWVGLTPTDMEELSSEWWTPNENEMALINWVEAKLKEKNT